MDVGVGREGLFLNGVGFSVVGGLPNMTWAITGAVMLVILRWKKTMICLRLSLVLTSSSVREGGRFDPWLIIGRATGIITLPNSLSLSYGLGSQHTSLCSRHCLGCNWMRWCKLACVKKLEDKVSYAKVLWPGRSFEWEHMASSSSSKLKYFRTH